jgi:hypothetical protein
MRQAIRISLEVLYLVIVLLGVILIHGPKKNLTDLANKVK